MSGWVSPISLLHEVALRRRIAATRWRKLRLSLVQSVDGSPRLPLLQIGACDFRLTPLLSILLLVTHTCREIVPVLPRFRIVAMSMERLQVRIARIPVVAIDMVHLDPVVMLEEPSTIATSAALLFEQPGQSCTDTGVSALSRAPVDPVPIIGTAVALNLHMPGRGHLAVSPQVPGMRVGGRGGKGQTGVYPMPVPPDGPGGRFPRMSPACPVAKLDPRDTTWRVMGSGGTKQIT
jgi:hypothetical protein